MFLGCVRPVRLGVGTFILSLCFALSAGTAKPKKACRTERLDDATARFVGLVAHYHDKRLLGTEDLAALEGAENVFNPLSAATAGRPIERHVAAEAFQSLIEEGVDFARVKEKIKALREGKNGEDVTRDHAKETTAWHYSPRVISRDEVALPQGKYIDELRAHPAADGGVIYSAKFDRAYRVFDTIDGKPSAKAYGARVADVLAMPNGKHLFTTIEDNALPPRSASLNTMKKPLMWMDYEGVGYDRDGRREVFAFLGPRGQRGILTTYGGTGIRSWTFERTPDSWTHDPLPGPSTFARTIDGKHIYSATMVDADGHRNLQIRDAISDEILETRPFIDEKVPEAINLAMHVDRAGKRYVIARGPKITQGYDIDGGGSFTVPNPSFQQVGVMKMDEVVLPNPAFLEKKNGSVVFSYLCGQNKMVLIDFAAKTQTVLKLPFGTDGNDGHYLAELRDGRVVVTMTTDEGLQLVDFGGGVVLTFPDKEVAKKYAGQIVTPDNRLVLVPKKAEDAPLQVYGPPATNK